MAALLHKWVRQRVNRPMNEEDVWVIEANEANGNGEFGTHLERELESDVDG